ncbi:MAG TPA: fasciclin domain-containing protein [Pyrinomonadaceae bacterium]|nr:fasciclin domain-containing protein [Pyrinomonadaceae bacterium]
MEPKYDIIETALRAGHFEVFARAIERARFKQTLKNTGPYTIFAPTDEAFARHADFKELLKPEKMYELESLLRHHIVPGKLNSAELKNIDRTTSAEGTLLRIEFRQALWVNEGQVVRPDLEGTNGVIHGVDSVLMPEAKAVVGSR